MKRRVFLCGVGLILPMGRIGGRSRRAIRAGRSETASGWVYPEPVASWPESEKERQRDAARKLMADLNQAIQRKATTFTIPPGDYRFGSPDLRNFTLTAVADLSMEAQGATFWFNGRFRADGVHIIRSRNVSLHGLTIDFDPFPYTQGEVVAIDRVGKTVDIRIDPGFPLPDETWTRRTGSVKAIYYGPDVRQRDVRMDWVKSFDPHGGGGDAGDERMYTVRFLNGWLFTDQTDVTLGDRLALPDRSMRHAAFLEDCEAVTLEDLTVYAAPQMVFTEVGGAGGHVYRRCRVVRRPDTRRLLASNADVFHSIAVVKGPRIEGCEFSHAGDDMVNIHNYFSMIYEPRQAGSVLLVENFVRQISAGTELTFYDFATLEPRGVRHVVKVAVIEDDASVQAARNMTLELRSRGDRVTDFNAGASWLLQVELDQPVEANKYDIVGCDAAAASGAIIQDSHFHDGFVRGVLVRCPHARIENNRFERMGFGGIEIAAERPGMEGPFPHDIIVRNNLLVDCGSFLTSRLPGSRHLGAITVMSEGGKGLTPFGLSSHIQIGGNTIVRPGACGIFAVNLANSLIEGNEITAPVSRQPLGTGTSSGPANPACAIFVDAADEVVLRGNVVRDPSPFCRGDVKLGAGARNCTFDPAPRK